MNPNHSPDVARVTSACLFASLCFLANESEGVVSLNGCRIILIFKVQEFVNVTGIRFPPRSYRG